MWRSVIDTKQGKVWANHPKDQRMMVVADVEEDANKYWMWNKLVRAIREADEINIEVFGKLIEKNFKKTVVTLSFLCRYGGIRDKINNKVPLWDMRNGFWRRSCL